MFHFKRNCLGQRNGIIWTYPVLWIQCARRAVIIDFRRPITRIRFNNNAAFNGLKPLHGPQVWRWWHLFSLHTCTLRLHAPTTGYRLWIYSRWGSRHYDLVFDRRNLP